MAKPLDGGRPDFVQSRKFESPGKRILFCKRVCAKILARPMRQVYSGFQRLAGDGDAVHGVHLERTIDHQISGVVVFALIVVGHGDACEECAIVNNQKNIALYLLLAWRQKSTGGS
jgi:hypothetical protein